MGTQVLLSDYSTLITLEKDGHMPFLSVLRQPWCLFSLSLLIILLLVAAALVSRSRRNARRQRRSERPLPSTPRDGGEVAASAPFEALQALAERLAELQRHLPVDSADAQWLQSYRNDLRNVMDDLYWEVFNEGTAERTLLLERLGGEVEQLERTVSQRLSTRISGSTDREALHYQLEQLRRSIHL